MKQKNLNNDVLMKIINMQMEVARQGVDLHGIVSLIKKQLCHLVSADDAVVFITDENLFVHGWRYVSSNSSITQTIEWQNHIGQYIKSGEAFISQDIICDSRVKNKKYCSNSGYRSAVIFPLMCDAGIVGAIAAFSSAKGHFCEDKIRIMELIAEFIAPVILNTVNNEESALFYRATHDYLTGFANRYLFYDRFKQKLSQARRNRERFGVITLDMDGLKAINDTYGHLAGDAAIKETAQRIHSTLRAEDTVARIGGDEFGILVANAQVGCDLRGLIQRMDEEIMRPFVFERWEIALRASMGYAVFNEDGCDLDTLLERADQAMYEMKKVRKIHSKMTICVEPL